MNNAVLAVDLGGTNTRMGVVDTSGRICSSARSATPKSLTPERLLETVESLRSQVVSGVPAENLNILGIGFGVPAPVSADFDGVLTKLPNLPGLEGMNIEAAFRSVYQLPVTVENDATAAALGEHWLGATRPVQNSICVTLGTGIGGGIIFDGEAFRGPDGTAGELGHICVEPDGHPCGCGSNGCVEQYASATAVTRMAREEGMDARDSRDVHKAFVDGDPIGKAVFEKMGRYLGIVLAGVVNLINPDRIVICGGLSSAWDAFMPSVQRELTARAYEAPTRRATVVRGELGDSAGTLGVARSTLSKCLRR